MTDDLKSLRDIISSSIDTISAICEEKGGPFPSLNEPIDPSEFTPHGIRNEPRVAESIDLIISAAAQLIATVRVPPVTMTIAALRHTLSAALGVVEAGNVAEILRDAGPQGLHVNDIASRSDMHPKKLGLLFLVLYSKHWFREVSPDVFTNNLLSSLLDSGKQISTGFDKSKKHDNSKGMSAVAGYGADECMKSGAYLVEAMTDPNERFSEEPNCSPIQKAFNMTDTFFEFYDRPSEQYRRDRFAKFMADVNKMHTPEGILSAYDWGSLDGRLIVDVGGGLGHVSLEIARENPSVHIVVEDRPLVVEEARHFWEENLPSHVTENKVQFIGIDFFEAQPTLLQPVDVFLLRMIIHDWSDKYAIKILRRLRDVANPNTKIIIVDNIIDHVCDPGKETKKAPAPLLMNMGGANLLPYVVDIAVFDVCNAGERTVEGFVDILGPSGWRLQEIRRTPVSTFFKSAIIAVPV